MWICNPVLIQIEDMTGIIICESYRNTMFACEDPYYRSWHGKRVNSIFIYHSSNNRLNTYQISNMSSLFGGLLSYVYPIPQLPLRCT